MDKQNPIKHAYATPHLSEALHTKPLMGQKKKQDPTINKQTAKNMHVQFLSTYLQQSQANKELKSRESTATFNL